MYYFTRFLGQAAMKYTFLNDKGRMFRNCLVNFGQRNFTHRVFANKLFPQVFRRFNSNTARAENGKIPRIERELPDPFAERKQNINYLVVYFVAITVSCAIIFNYEKTRSPVTNSVLFCLRRSQQVKETLGSNIGFQSSWPWIKGTLNSYKGIVDIEFSVSGSKTSGVVHIKASRDSPDKSFRVSLWTLTIDDSQKTVIDLRKDPNINTEF